MTRRSFALGGLGGVLVVGAGVAKGVLPGRAELKAGVWCGRSDPLYSDVRAFVSALPARPQIVSYGAGAHTRAYWDSVTLPAFAFVGAAL